MSRPRAWRRYKNYTKAKRKREIDLNDRMWWDYSIYNNPALKDRLQDCGLDSVVSVFRIEYPDRQRMVLSGKKTVLRFRKW